VTGAFADQKTLKEFASCTHWPPPHVVIWVGAVPAEGMKQLT
jgi:hypothetical protein